MSEGDELGEPLAVDEVEVDDPEVVRYLTSNGKIGRRGMNHGTLASLGLTVFENPNDNVVGMDGEASDVVQVPAEEISGDVLAVVGFAPSGEDAYIAAHESDDV